MSINRVQVCDLQNSLPNNKIFPLMNSLVTAVVAWWLKSLPREREVVGCIPAATEQSL